MYGEGAVTDQMCQKWFAKFHAGDFFLDNVPQLGWQSNRDINWEQSTSHQAEDSRHTQSIQINKVIGEHEKCVFYFTEKNHMDFLANPLFTQ